MTRLRAVLAGALVALLAVPAVADAATTKETRDRQRAVQRQKAQAAAKVDALKATEAELERALEDLNAHVRAERARAEAAASSARAAEARAADARSRRTAIEARLASVKGTLREAAVRSYIAGGDEVMVGLEAESLQELSKRRAFMGVVTGRTNDLADELAAGRRDLEEERQVAERAEAEARARHAEAEAGLDEVKAARDAKAKLADAAEARLERALAESAALEATDRKLAAELARQNRRLARGIGTDGRARGPARQVGNVSVTNVRGIVVATSIAGQVERLQDAASADGFSLSGGGYRDSSQQVAARRANCGSSNYDIYEKPASQCNPPTARPGQSMHEQGLAIDFANNGALIRSRSNPAFRWLQANAGRYGLRNLPAEPWHWSTNGN